MYNYSSGWCQFWASRPEHALVRKNNDVSIMQAQVQRAACHQHPAAWLPGPAQRCHSLSSRAVNCVVYTVYNICLEL